MSSGSCPVCQGTSPTCPIAADWADEERMAFLTSHVAASEQEALSNHQSHAREEMLEFWSKAVGHAFQESTSADLSLDLEVLAKDTLAWHDVVAPGLELAIGNMISSGELMFRGDLEVDKGFARHLVETPLVYLFSMLGLDGSKQSIPAGQYIHRHVLEAVAERLVKHCHSLPEEERTVYLDAQGPANAIIHTEQQKQTTPPSTFQQLCAAAGSAAVAAPPRITTYRSGHAPGSGTVGDRLSVLMSKLFGDDVALLAKHMVRTKRAVRDIDAGLLKVLAPGPTGQGSRTARGLSGISQLDKDLLKLRHTVSNLQAYAASLDLRIADLKRDALRANKEGQKNAALVHMRRMKRCQVARDNRLSSLYTLEAALDQVNRLRLDKQVLEAHEAATKALKSCRETHGLTVERVETTLDALAEEMADTEAVGNALAQHHEAITDEDEEAELQEELEELFREESEHLNGTADVVTGVTTVDYDPNRPRIAVPLQPQPTVAENADTPVAKHGSGGVLVASNKEGISEPGGGHSPRLVPA